MEALNTAITLDCDHFPADELPLSPASVLSVMTRGYISHSRVRVQNDTFLMIYIISNKNSSNHTEQFIFPMLILCRFAS